MKRAFWGLSASLAVCSAALSVRSVAAPPVHAPPSAPAAGAAPASLMSPFPSPPETTRFSNGLTLITLRWPSPGIVAYYTLVRVGARDEVEKGHSGFAHLFEHMMFRGTKRFPKEVYEQRIQDLGADNNAYTTQDYTLYTLTGPRDALADMVELEADRFQNLFYDEASFRTETGAVLGEYNKSAASPFLKLWEVLSEQSFERHTYGHTTIGYLDDILAMPEEYAYSQDFFKRFYTPDNTTIIVAGDVTHDAVKKLVAERYGGWQGTREQPEIPHEEEPRGGKLKHLDWEGIATPQMVIGYRAPAFEGTGSEQSRRAQLRETAALEVLHGLTFAQASPLYQGLVVDEQELLELSSWNANFSRDPGLFVVHAELSPTASFAAITSRIQAALLAVARGEGKERVAAVRSHLLYSIPMNMETASDAADAFAQFVALTGETSTMTDYLTALSEVRPEDVAAVAAKYLTPERRVVVTLAPRAAEATKAGEAPFPEADAGPIQDAGAVEGAGVGQDAGAGQGTGAGQDAGPAHDASAGQDVRPRKAAGRRQAPGSGKDGGAR